MTELNSRSSQYLDFGLGGEPRIRPKPGTISRDRVAISGCHGYIDLFEGGNSYYQRYFKKNYLEPLPVGNTIANELAELRLKVLSKGGTLVFLCVPNKATSLAENYPLWLPNSPTYLFRELEESLGDLSGNLFCKWMLVDDFDSRKQYWLETDSHWNSFAAWSAAREIGNTLGVILRAPERTVVEPRWGGDLSGRWGETYLSEQRDRLYGDDAHRRLVFDNGFGVEQSAHEGRFLLWENSSAPIDQEMAIVGDSFSGVGTSPEHLTYWLSLLFRKTYFFHGAAFPEDIFERCKSRHYVFQTNERFLPVAPLSRQPIVHFENLFMNRIGKRDAE